MRGIPRHILVAVAIATAARWAYLVAFGNPFGSGPDAFNYHRGAVYVLHNGVLSSDIPLIPFAPPGYTMFINLCYTWFSADPRVVSLIQIGLLAVATVVAYLLIRRELNEQVATITTVLMSASPAFLILPTFLMYESLLLVGTVIGVDLCSRAAASGNRQVLRAGLAGVTLGLASTVQPKLLPAVVLIAGWLLWKTRQFWVVAVFLVASALGPAAVIARTLRAEGAAVLSVNAGTNMWIGLNDAATGAYGNKPHLSPGCPKNAYVSHEQLATDDLIRRDSALIKCSIGWARTHPTRTAILTVKKFLYFWSPMIGPHGGNWMAAIDPRNALPSSLHRSGGFQTVDFLLRSGLTVLLLALVAVGIATGLKEHRAGSLLFVCVIGAFVFATLISIGDARFRLPIAPYYLAFVALAAQRLYARARTSSSG